MSDYKSYKDQSRRLWYSKERQQSASDEDIKIGCLQRIADATELMSKNYLKMQEDLNYYKRNYHTKRDYAEKLERKISALKGVITKLKNKNKNNGTQI